MLKLKEARERAGLTQKEIALSLGVSVQSVSNWEVGNREPSIEVILKICNLCNVSADSLLGRVPFEVKKEAPPEKPDGVKRVQITIPQSASEEQQREALEALVQQMVCQELDRRNSQP